MAQQISTPAELAASIDGKSDAEITQSLIEAGIDEALERIFEGMAGAFLPERASGRTAVVQWNIATPQGERSYQVEVAGDKCAARKTAGQPANVTLAASLPDFLRIITGKLNGAQAFMAGKLRITGDMVLAQLQQTWFTIPS